MNRLKYVLGVRVPRRIPSSTAITNEARSKEICKKHSSEMHLRPLLKSVRLFSPRPRRINDFRSFHCVGPARNETLYAAQRIRPKSDSISLKRPPLERKFPAECVQRRRSSTYQLRKPSSARRHFVPTNQMIQEAVRNRKILKMRQKQEIDRLLPKEPRSYAQLIANYSEMMYGEPGTKIMKDGFSPIAINGVHRSPFSTTSVVSTKWKCKPKSVKSGCLRVTSQNMLNQEAKFSSDTSTMRYEYRNDSNSFTVSDNEERNTFERLSYSYAMMIERYSNALDVDASDCNWNNLVPKCNTITKLNDFPAIFMDTPKRMTEIGLHERDEGAPLTRSSVQKVGMNWMSKMEDMIKDLKRITLKKEAVDCKSSEKSSLQSVNERAEWMDRVVGAHKKRKPISSINSEPNSALNSPVMNENHGLPRATLIASSSKSSSIADYIKRGPVSGSTTSQPPTNVATASTKQPQIELRMTPSQNESVVSINVDEQAAKSAGTGMKEQLSVVISSKKNNARAETSNTNFDSMQISISENTVPVKQIEFSINGKPVSELKSIVARADKLDVLSSMDKVEIRIPQAENASKQTNVRATPTQVLNLQIAAKFNEPRAHPRDTGIKTSTALSPTAPASVPPPGPQPVPTPTQAPPFNNPRTQNLASRTIITRSVDANKSNMNMPSRNSPQSRINENSDTSIPNDDRTPSNIIPWWSSEDSFRKIRKKRNPPKSLAAFDNLTKVEEHVGAQRKFEETLNPGTQSIDFVDRQKTQGPAKDLTWKKPELKENSSDVSAATNNFQKTPADDFAMKPKKTDSPNLSKQTFRVVRSPRKMPIKRTAGFKTNKVKKAKHRVKNPRISVVTNKKGKPIIPAAPAKTVKYVPVNPQRILVLENPKRTVEELGKELAKRLKAKSKNEGLKEGTKSAAEDAETNAQHPNTVLKAKKDLEKPDNKSADVSAKAAGREGQKRLESGKSSPVDEEPDQRIKQILKSMKPIEKRKDGTLIDYGVVVPSRKPSKIRHVPATRIDKKETSLQEKIVEPRKVLKNQTLKEPESVKKIEPEKIIFAKKGVESTNPEVKDKKKLFSTEQETPKDVKKLQTHVASKDSADTKLSDKNQPLKVTDGTKETSADKFRALSKIVNSTKIVSEDSSKLKPSESKSFLKPENKEKTLKTDSMQSSKIVVKSGNTNMADRIKSSFNKLTKGHVQAEEQGSKTALKSGSEAKEKLEKLPVQPSKVTIKTSDINVTNSSKPKLADRVKVIIVPGNQASKSTFSKIEEKKVDVKLSQPSKVPIKPSDTNITTSKSKMADKLKNITTAPENQASKSTFSKIEEKKVDVKLSEPSKIPIKPSDTNITSSKSKMADKLKNITTAPENQASKIPLSKVEEKKVDAKLSQPSKIPIKPIDTNITTKSQMPDKLKNITITYEKQASKSTLSKIEEKKVDVKLSEPSKIPIKPIDTNITTKPKMADKVNVITVPGKQDSKSMSKVEEKKVDVKPSQPPKVSAKPSDSIANFSKSKSAKEPTPGLQFTEKAERNILTPGAQEKVDSPCSADKKVTRTDSLPLTGAIVPPSQKASDKGAKNDSKSSEESNVQSGKKLITAETAPLEGTINYQTGKKLDNLTSSSGTRRKKTLSEVIEQRRKDLRAKSNASSRKGGGGSGGPATPTGPGGILSTRSFTVSQECANMQMSSNMKSAVSGIEEKLNKSDEHAKNETPHQSNQRNELLSSKFERPEKNMLYSSWLQRFKNKLDDDNVT